MQTYNYLKKIDRKMNGRQNLNSKIGNNISIIDIGWFTLYNIDFSKTQYVHLII